MPSLPRLPYPTHNAKTVGHRELPAGTCGSSSSLLTWSTHMHDVATRPLVPYTHTPPPPPAAPAAASWSSRPTARR